jgi:hypothetical protein
MCRWVDGVRTEERKAQREEMGVELGVRTEVCINFQKRERGAGDGKGTERVSACWWCRWVDGVRRTKGKS